MRKVKLDAVSCQATDVAMRVYQAIGSPKANEAAELLMSKQYQKLITLEVDPALYTDHNLFADDYLVVKLMSKFPHFPVTDPEQVATEAFWASEQLCKATNERIRHWRTSPEKAGTLINQVLHLAAGKIAQVLGVPRIPEIVDACGWGPGVSSSSKGCHTSVYNKFSDQPGATPDLITAGGHQLINAYPLWSAVLLQAQDEKGLAAPCSVLSAALPRVPGNAVAFVPKNAKTHRAIAVEPHLNAFLQKGIGGVMRKRLKRIKTPFGIDLDNQIPNQEMAQLGSWDNSLATVDLSAASDTISIELVRQLLPEPWFDLCDLARSKFGSLDGKWFRYHKFSSMGNGFTFELESLIFWALTHSVVSYMNSDTGWVRVFGDDIICPAECYDTLVQVLGFCGFKVNASKSFHDGPFRESCGKDFFKGSPVRPFFFKEEVKDARNVYRMANAIRRYGRLRNHNHGSDGRFRSVWNYLLSRVPKPLRLMIPDGIGDGGFISNFDEATPSALRKGTKKRKKTLHPQGANRLSNGFEGYSFVGLVEKPVKRDFHRILPGVAMMLWTTGPQSLATPNGYKWGDKVKGGIPRPYLLRLLPTREELKQLTREGAPTHGSYNLRERTTPRAQTMTVRTWPNLGPWF